MNHTLGLVRRGNHFIWLERAGWLLIDGPWYERLERLGVGFSRVNIGVFRPGDITLESPRDECSPFLSPPTPMSWERVWYQPSHYTPSCYWDHSRFGSYLRARVPARSDPMNRLIVLLQNHLREKWRRRMRDNLKQGWLLWPDGRIPAYFAWPDWIEDEYLAEDYENE